jgi:hypothetical protein
MIEALPSWNGASLTRHSYLSVVAARSWPRWHKGGVVVGSHLGVGAVDRRLVEAGLGDAGAQIVGHHRRRSPADEGPGARMPADPVGQALHPGGPA